MANSYSLSLTPASGSELRYELQRAWEALLQRQNHLHVTYQSPDWFQHLRRTEPEVPMLLARVESEDGVAGLVPLWLRERQLRFDLGNRVLGSVSFKAAHFIGGQPLLPPDPALHDRFFRELWDYLGPEHDCIALSSVRCDSFLWRYLHESRELRRHCNIYAPEGRRLRRAIELPDTFAEYLGKFSAKTRNTLRRKVRKLDRDGGGMRLARIERVEQVDEFVRGALSVADHSWQGQELGVRIGGRPGDREKFEDLARAGLMRSYLLYAGEQPCAFVLGYQYRHIFHYAEVGFDQRYARLSPSTVLLYLLIEDLIEHRRAGQLDFGLGEYDYKRHFGNSSFIDATVLLYRRTWRNRARHWSHAGFRGSVGLAKRALGRTA